MARVLVVDEDVILRDFLKSSLAGAGFEVDVTGSPPARPASDYDAVLTEIERPFSLDKLHRRMRVMGLT